MFNEIARCSVAHRNVHYRLWYRYGATIGFVLADTRNATPERGNDSQWTLGQRENMSPLAAEASASGSSLLTFLLLGSLIFSFGYARAVWVRARKDYLSTKAAVKPLQTAMWKSIWTAVKVGVGVFVAGLIIIAWFVSEVRH